MNIIHGDCLEELKKLDDNSVDAVVCDPPYGLSNTKPQQVADVLKAWVTGDAEAVPTTKVGFMNASWDSFVPPPAVWEECMRVLKPGGHMAVFAGARTQDLMGLSIRLVGFEIRDTLGWITGSGFPKSHSVKRTTLKKVEERYGFARCDCLDTGDGQSDRHGVGQSGRGQAGAGGGSRQIPPQETGDRTVSNVPRSSGDRVCELRGEGSEESGSLRQVEEPILLNGVRQCRAEKEGHGHAEVRAGVEISEGRDSRKGRSVPLVRQESGEERECTSCPSSSSFQVQRDEQAGESSSTVRFMPSQHRGSDGQGFSIDPSRSNPRRIYPDSDGGWGDPVARVCSWCGLPDVDWLDGLDSLGTALKPAIEPIILARKPLDGTVANNVLAHGVGGLNIDACRVQTDDDTSRPPGRDGGNATWDLSSRSEPSVSHSAGRFPANVLLDEHAAKEMGEQSGNAGGGFGVRGKGGSTYANGQGFANTLAETGQTVGYGDSGGASRFFPVFKYQAKAPKRERPVIEREDGSKIQHATVKPLALMEWLVSLIVPPGGVVLDPFAGSGTTLQAAINKGFQPIGIEQDADYIKLINKRLEATCTTHKN